MSARIREFWLECNHEWRTAGDPFKTYPRAAQGPDNPLRQAYKCKWCHEVHVEVVSTERKP